MDWRPGQTLPVHASIPGTGYSRIRMRLLRIRMGGLGLANSDVRSGPGQTLPVGYHAATMCATPGIEPWNDTGCGTSDSAFAVEGGEGELAPDRGKMRTREAIAKLAADFWKRTNKNLEPLKVFNGRVLSVHQHDLTRDASAADTRVEARIPAGGVPGVQPADALASDSDRPDAHPHVPTGGRGRAGLCNAQLEHRFNTPALGRFSLRGGAAATDITGALWSDPAGTLRDPLVA